MTHSCTLSCSFCNKWISILITKACVYNSYWLLLAKIYKYVPLTVCLFVCLLRDNSRRLQHITKLDTNKDHGSVKKPMIYLGHRSNNEVMTLKSRSNFEIAITPLIFKLEHRSMAQNVGNALGYWGNILNFQWHFWPKFYIRYKKISQILTERVLLTLLTSLMMS